MNTKHAYLDSVVLFGCISIDRNKTVYHQQALINSLLFIRFFSLFFSFALASMKMNSMYFSSRKKKEEQNGNKFTWKWLCRNKINNRNYDFFFHSFCVFALVKLNSIIFRTILKINVYSFFHLFFFFRFSFPLSFQFSATVWPSNVLFLSAAGEKILSC